MGTYNVHAGHCPSGKGASGAVGILNESNEARKVKDEVIRLLRANGHTVYDCTCDVSKTASGCLSYIVNKCNAHSVNLDVSIHLNAGGGTGCEVLIYSNSTAAKDEAERISANISSALGIKNRGVKLRPELYVLKHTKSPALLVECCFVDSKNDADRWNVSSCAKAIVEGILNANVNTPSAPSTPAPSAPSGGKEPALGMGDRGSEVKELQKMLIACGYSCGSAGADGIFGSGTKNAVIKFQKAYGLSADGLAGKRTMAKLRSVYSGASKSSSSGNWISRLQAECNRQGFSNQKVDGIAGKNTLAGCPTCRKGAKGNITKLIQERLISLGFSCGSTGADGVFGNGTKNAIIKFQKSRGLSADGIVGKNTWRKLLGM